MSEGISNRFRLIAVPSNQGLCNHYESGIKSYVQDKEDRLWKDDYYPAWHNDRIGGERAAMVSRLDAQKRFVKNNFEQFKVARLAEIEKILGSQDVDLNQKKAVAKEKYILTQSHSYMEFGKNMKFADPYARSFTLHNPDNHDDKAQVLYNCNYIKPIVDGRYDMMQSIAFQITNGEELPVMELQAEKYRTRILNGFRTYKSEADKHTHWYQWQRTDDMERDKVAYQNVREPAFEAKGYTETLNDAILAITTSPEWPLICKYYQSKHYGNNSNAYGAWDEGTVASLEPLIGSVRIDLRSIKSEGIIYDDISQIAEPSLQNLKRAELMYNFLAQHVNEYTVYKKEHAQEIEVLNKTRNERFVLDTKEYGNMMKQTCTVLNGLCNRMVSDHQAIATVYEVGKETLIGASFFIPYVGPYVGVAAVGTNILTMEAQQEMVKGWADRNNWQWATDIKNAPVLEDAKKIIEQSQDQIKRNERYLCGFSDEEFKNAVKWASENGDVNTKNMMNLVLKSIEWREKSPEERERILNDFEKEEQDEFYVNAKKKVEQLAELSAKKTEYEEKLKKEPNNEVLKKEYEKFSEDYDKFQKENKYDIEAYEQFQLNKIEVIACDTAVKTGHYFANAYTQNEYLAALSGDGRIKKIRTQLSEHFNANEREMMADVEKALAIQNASNFEVKMRGDLILKWRTNQNNIQVTPKKQEEQTQQETKPAVNETLKNASEKNVDTENPVDNSIDSSYDIYDDIYMY